MTTSDGRREAEAGASRLMRSANRRAGLVLGGVLAALGVAGLVASLGVPLTDPRGVPLVAALTVNPLQSILTVMIGVALVVPAVISLPFARRANGAIGTVLLIAGIAGLYVIDTAANVLAITSTNTVIQFGAAALLLAVALGADRPPAAATARDSQP